MRLAAVIRSLISCRGARPAIPGGWPPPDRLLCPHTGPLPHLSAAISPDSTAAGRGPCHRCPGSLPRRRWSTDVALRDTSLLQRPLPNCPIGSHARNKLDARAERDRGEGAGNGGGEATYAAVVGRRGANGLAIPHLESPFRVFPLFRGMGQLEGPAEPCAGHQELRDRPRRRTLRRARPLRIPMLLPGNLKKFLEMGASAMDGDAHHAPENRLRSPSRHLPRFLAALEIIWVQDDGAVLEMASLLANNTESLFLSNTECKSNSLEPSKTRRMARRGSKLSTKTSAVVPLNIPGRLLCENTKTPPSMMLPLASTS